MGMIMWPGTESSIQAAFFFFRVEGAAKALADIFIIFSEASAVRLKSGPVLPVPFPPGADEEPDSTKSLSFRTIREGK